MPTEPEGTRTIIGQRAAVAATSPPNYRASGFVHWAGAGDGPAPPNGATAGGAGLPAGETAAPDAGGLPDAGALSTTGAPPDTALGPAPTDTGPDAASGLLK